MDISGEYNITVNNSFQASRPQRPNISLLLWTLPTNNAPLLIPLSTRTSALLGDRSSPVPRLPRQLLKLDIHLHNLRDPTTLFTTTSIAADSLDLPPATPVISSLCRSSVSERALRPESANFKTDGGAEQVFDECR